MQTAKVRLTFNFSWKNEQYMKSAQKFFDIMLTQHRSATYKNGKKKTIYKNSKRSHAVLTFAIVIARKRVASSVFINRAFY